MLAASGSAFPAHGGAGGALLLPGASYITKHTHTCSCTIVSQAVTSQQPYGVRTRNAFDQWGSERLSNLPKVTQLGWECSPT